MNFRVSPISIIVTLLFGSVLSFVLYTQTVKDFFGFLVYNFFPFTLPLLAMSWLMIKINKVGSNERVQAIVLGIFTTITQTLIILLVGLINLISGISSKTFEVSDLTKVREDGSTRIAELILFFFVLLVINVFLGPLFSLFFAGRQKIKAIEKTAVEVKKENEISSEKDSKNNLASLQEENQEVRDS